MERSGEDLKNVENMILEGVIGLRSETVQSVLRLDIDNEVVLNAKIIADKLERFGSALGRVPILEGIKTE